MSICPKGMWVTQPHALQKLGLASATQLNEGLKAGSYPHVLEEKGSSVKSAKAPFTQHRFFYITSQGQSAQSNLSLKLMQWITVCQALGDTGDDLSDMDPRHLGLLARYAGKPSVDPNALGSLVQELKDAQAVILPDALKQIPATDGAASLDALLDQSSGARPTGDSHTVSGPVSSSKPQEGEIYIRADGKKVRRVKKKTATASSSQSVAPTPTASLSAHLGPSGTKGPGGDSATVPGNMGTSQQHEEGEIYIRADGKKVRRVKKKKPPADSASVAPTGTSLGSMLDGAAPKPTQGDSATVPGNMGASKPVEEGEIYIRADGKKVRRVKKKPAGDAASVAAPAAAPEEGEIYIRADGKKVRRVKKKPAGQAQTLGGMLDSNATPAKVGSGSATVTGAESGGLQQEGEIYIRADGKKVRRIKKTRSVSGNGLNTFLGNNEAQRPQGGSATVSGDGKELGEIYIRADGKKVRRVKKNPQAAAPTSNQSLAGFLDTKTGGTGMSGSATVTGAEGHKAKYTEGEIYIRPDGKKVRRIKKTAKTEEQKKKEEEEKKKAEEEAKKKAEEEEAKKKAEEEAAKKAEEGEKKEGEEGEKKEGAEIEGGDPKPEEPKADEAQSQPAASAAGDLAGFLDKEADGKPKLSGSATVAGEMVAPKAAAPAPAVEEEVEIITRPDGTKVRRIRRRVPAGGGDKQKSLDAFMGQNPAAKPSGGNATVAGDGQGEIFVRPDGTKVRRVRRTSSAAAGDLEGEIITRPDGTKVRRVVRKSQVASSGAAGDIHDTSKTADTLDGFMSSQPEGAVGSGDAATVAGDMVKREPLADVLTGGATQQAAAPASQEQTPVSASPAAPQPAVATPSAAQPAQGAQDGNHAYIVVVGDEDKDKGKGKVEAAPEPPTQDPTVGPNGEQRFAVKVAAGAEGLPQQLKVESDVRYLTLDELANLSGQSKDSLNSVVQQKMNLDKATPRFVLSPMGDNGQPVPPPAPAPATAPAPAPAPPPAPAPAAGPKPGQKGTFMPEGMVAVSEDVAEAARAMEALGTTDINALMEKLNQGDVGEILKKLQDAEKRQKKLEKQLAQAGVAIADDIPYEEANEMVAKIAKRMGEIGGSDVTHPDKEEQAKLREEYFKLEQDMERYNSALMITEEYQAEQDRIEKQWEDDNFPHNQAALKQLRRHMPVNIRNLSEAALTNTPSPNGKYLPKATAKKFKRTNVLMLLRLNPDDIERMHPSTLDNMRVTGLTLTERRALYAHLQPCGPKWHKNKAEKMTERKWTWYNMMKNNFKESLAPYNRHIAQYGPPDNHPYATRDDPTAGCPMIGKQCPVKADKNPDYTGDYGWTDADEYEPSQVTKSDVDDPGAKAMQEALELAKEKKANERAVALKKHYKGVMFVSKANGSCEQMDETMDNMEAAQMKWIENMLSNENFTDDDKKKEVASFTESLNLLKLAVLDFAGRAGIQTSGRKKAGGDGPDTRSSVEAALMEDLHETGEVFFKFIKDRMEEMKVKDTRVSKTIELLEGMLGDLHGKNVDTLKKLGVERPERSRKLKTTEQMKEEAQKKLVPPVEEPVEDFGQTDVVPIPQPPRGGRGGLMNAIAGRGRGGRGGGRGGLMDAIAGRGRGGGRGGGGRGGLLGAIAGRGKKGPGGGGGRGGLLDAIAGRGKKGPGGGGDGGGGRGGLMGAIQGRGRGGGGGGRGGLMAAIAARGGG